MPEKPPRAPTFGAPDERRDRRHRDSAGAPAVPRGEFDPDDITGRYERGEIDEETLAEKRIQRELVRLDDKHDELATSFAEWKGIAAGYGDRLARVDRTFEQLGRSLTKQAELVTRNDELIHRTVWPETQKQMGASAELERRVAATERVAASIETLVGDIRSDRARIAKLEAGMAAETAQIAALEKQAAETAHRSSHNTSRIEALEKSGAADGRELQLTRASQRFWRRHLGKAIAAIAVAIAGAVGGVISHYLAPNDQPPHIGDH